jgi:predicted nucleotidyltransferase
MDSSQKTGSLRDRLTFFCRSHPVEALYAFGSRAREIYQAMDGERLVSGQSSDLDLAVKLQGDRKLSVREKVELAIGLENLLGVDRVDLVVLSEADPFLAVNVIRGERVFCRDDYAADDYDLYVLRRAGDLEPFERLRIEQSLSKQNDINVVKKT